VDLIFHISQGEENIILDVRPKEEWHKFHVQGAVSCPVEAIAERSKKLDKEFPTYIHCDKVSRYSYCGNVFRNLTLNPKLDRKVMPH